nr:LuxR family transcriptional regulator [Mycobacterium sp. 3519A]
MDDPVEPGAAIVTSSPHCGSPTRGRSAELTVLDTAISALLDGRAGVVVLEGPPGIGKSHLLAEAQMRAEQRGVRTLRGQGFEYRQSAPFYPLFSATLHADPPVGDAAALRRLGDTADLRYWVIHDLRAAINAAATQQPIAILLDDIHWADNATLLALRVLALQKSAPVLWILAARQHSGDAAARQTMAELRRGGATFVQVRPLSPDDVVEVVQDSVRASADSSLLSLAAKAHGSPFLLIELLRGLEEEGRLHVRAGCASAAGEGLPRRLAIGMEQRLDELSDEAAEIVRVAATLPDRFTVTLLAAILQRPPAALMAAVQEAVRADLLAERGDNLTFRHDLLRYATRASMPRSLCRAIERQSAATLLELGAAPEMVATQLARSAEPGDQAAVTALRQAATSVGRSDPGAAADLAQRALELLARDDPAREPLVAEAVALLNRANRYREAQQLAGTVLLSSASQEGEAEIRLRIASGTEAPEERIAENRKALELVTVNDVTRARHLAWLAYFEAVNGMQADAHTADQAWATANACADLEAQIVSGTALGMVELHGGRVSQACQRMESLAVLAHSADTTLGHVIADIHRVRLVVTFGCLEKAREEVAGGIGRARRNQYSMALMPWAVLDGMTNAAAGRLAAARAAIEALPNSEWGNVTENNMMRMLVLAEVAVRTDDRNLLQHVIEDARALCCSASPLVAGGASYVIAQAAWHRGDVAEALRRFAHESAGLITPLWLNVIDQLVLAARVAAAADDACLRARVEDSIGLLTCERPATPLLDAAAVHARGLLSGDPDLLTDAAAALHTRRPLLYAGAAADAGCALISGGRHPEAIEHLNAAFETFTRCEAVADARRVGRVLRTLGVQRRIVTRPRSRTGWDSLTDAELRVISVIRDGATNREAAEQLHLSLHTVKAHVRNAFAKLGIKSRAELARVGAEVDTVGEEETG